MVKPKSSIFTFFFSWDFLALSQLKLKKLRWDLDAAREVFQDDLMWIQHGGICFLGQLQHVFTTVTYSYSIQEYP